MTRSPWRRATRIIFAVVSCVGFAVASAIAQAPPTTGTLSVTVIDATGLIIPHATVSIARLDGQPGTKALEPALTADTGAATIAGLVPGRYSIEAAFLGFEKRLLNDVRVRVGDNKQVVLLTIQKVETSVTVEQDRQQAAADPRGPSFGTTLTRDQIEALSDDPETLRQQLLDMAGPGAIIRIDTFEGGALPAKAQIRSIRISRDQFAAENHIAGGLFIDIITQPGLGPIRYYTNLRLRNGSLSGRSPFIRSKGPEQNFN